MNQLCYNLLSRAIELEILPLCQQHGMGILGYMPLLQGLLTGMYKHGRRTSTCPCTVPAVSREIGEKAGHGEEGAEEEMFAAVEGIRKVAEAEGVPMSSTRNRLDHRKTRYHL